MGVLFSFYRQNNVTSRKAHLEKILENFHLIEAICTK